MLERFLGFTKYQLKRYLLFNAITMPVSTLLYLPYNLFVLGFSIRQVKLWILTGILFGVFVSLVMTWVNIFAVRMIDKFINKD